MNRLSRMQTVLLIAFLVITWGVNWPVTKFALQFTPPILFSGMRTLLGGIFLLVAALPKYKSVRFRTNWHIYAISALLNIILYYGLQTVGLQHLPSGLFSVLVFLQPVLVGIFSWLWLGEPMYRVKIFGLALGFAGVATIGLGGLSGHISAVGILLGLGSALSWALGTVYVKKAGENVDSIWLVTLQLIAGGLFMTGIGAATESWSAIVWSMPYIVSLLFISIFVIAIGWSVFFILIGSGEASKVAANTFLIPLVAIAVGVIFLHERFTAYLLAGLVLIMVSIYCVNRKPKRAAAVT
ncbi:hypothetical protein SD70_03055 [Gordoniibacillus kamchatkensis]|uniref:EamA domain-containing protein n=1 Tax=Gordoniibacillus kamchatkensis TaxID=1590651 RepID=A0ABR5AMD8_9BACL|nr:DMT family transporter [Paenibacillus sp. VKM B-2647]KIL42159.1 hypothetical protein SD70_03055 [Paenibacillus sp. VKM B-2647]